MLAWEICTCCGLVLIIRNSVQYSYCATGIADSLLHEVDVGVGLVGLLFEGIILCNSDTGMSTKCIVLCNAKTRMLVNMLHGCTCCWHDQRGPNALGSMC